MKTAQRLAARAKAAQRHGRANPTASFALIADRSPMTPFDADRCSTEVRLAWHHLCHGHGTAEHFDTLATAMTICALRAQHIGDDAAEVAERAQLALVAMAGRYQRCGRFGPGADALLHVPYGLELYDELLRKCSAHQLNNALRQAEAMRSAATPQRAPAMPTAQPA